MKLSFSTLGCPDWSFKETVATARDLGYDGIEIRGVGEQLHAPAAKAFLPDRIEHSKSLLASCSLEIPLLSSSCYLHLKDNDNLMDAFEYVDLAEKLHAGGVRVLGDVGQAPSAEADDDLFVSRLKTLCSYAATKGVTVFTETNGVYGDSKRLLSVIERTAADNLRIIWDVMHPYCFFGENPEHTYSVLKDFIAHIHIKDCIFNNGDVSYKMLGYGELPVREIVKLLKDNGFGGYISLEWLKRWNKNLEEPGVVFAQYISKMRQYI